MFGNLLPKVLVLISVAMADATKSGGLYLQKLVPLEKKL